MSSKDLQDVLRTTSRLLEDALARHFQEVLEDENCNSGDVLEVNKCLLGLFNNVWINYNFVLDSFNLRFDRFLKFIFTT